MYESYGGGWGVGPNNAGTGGGYAESAFANPLLTWQKSLKTDVGLDFTLWNKVNVMLNYFYEYRYDILNSGSPLFPSYLGSTFGYVNYGEVASTGFEAQVGYSLQKKDWGIDVGFNVANHSNKVLRMREEAKNYPYLYRQGHPVGQRCGLIWEGYYSEDDVVNRGVTQSWGNVMPGSLKYKDVNGDGVVNSDDYVAIGKDSDVPRWELGMNLNVNYKGFYVAANLQAALGRTVDLRNSAPYATSPLYYDRNVSTWIKQPWTAEVANNPATAGTIDFPSLSIENNSNTFLTSTFFLRNGNFLRLRMLEVGYDMPEKWAKAIKMRSMKVYVRGMNLFTLDHLGGVFDPEVPEGYPVMKSYNVGLTFTF